MTSSLRSRYRLRWAPRGSRRCLYLSGSRLTVYQWRRGTLVEALLFQRSDEGLADFSAYLDADPETPAHLLLDLVEEEYRRDTIPHVLGRDRRNLIRFRVERAFRDTPYWHGVVQERESEGRRDDNLLMCAVTGPALVKPWVDRLLEHKVPLVGIHSLALVSASVLPVLGVSSGETLLVSLQSTGNLRQSFFVDRDLKLSRLAHMPLLAPEGVVETTIDEVEKLRRYLNSLRLLRRDGTLQVYVLAHGPVLDELRRQCVSGTATAYHVVDLADLAERLRMNPAFVTPYADAVFAQQVLVERPRNHYASSGETRYFTFYRVRNALRASGVALLLAGVIGGGLGVTEGLVLERRARSAAQQADFYAARYEEARGDLPQTPVDATDLKAAVETAEALARVRATPLPLLAAVSVALDAHPELQVDQVEWRVDIDPEAGIGQTRGAAVPARGARTAAPSPPEGGPYHLAVVSGRVIVPEGAFRQALEAVHGLVASLRAQAGVRDVRVLAQPLNVDSSESLRGDLETQPGAGRNDFSVRVVFGGGDAPA
jgi:hypothetical protein